MRFHMQGGFLAKKLKRAKKYFWLDYAKSIKIILPGNMVFYGFDGYSWMKWRIFAFSTRLLNTRHKLQKKGIFWTMTSHTSLRLLLFMCFSKTFKNSTLPSKNNSDNSDDPLKRILHNRTLHADDDIYSLDFNYTHNAHYYANRQ